MTAGAITLSESDFRKGLVAKRLAYGDAVREPLGLARIPTIVATCYKRAAIAVSEFKYEKPLADRTKALPAEDAFYLSIHLRGVSNRQIWLGDRAVETSPAAPASFAVHDLRQEPSFRSTTPAHAIGFYFSRDAIDILADDAGLARFGGFRLQAGDVAQDQVMHDMARVLLPLFGNPDQANQLFTDNLMMAIGAHVLATYGDAARMTATSKGGLAPWQDKRAKELLLANIGRDASIDDIAQDCGLSSGRFSKAFKEGNGVSPHKWLLAQRVEFAKSMLSGEETSLADIATSSGFSDQSHFTHTFTKLAGMSPGAFRRSSRQVYAVSDAQKDVEP